MKSAKGKNNSFGILPLNGKLVDLSSPVVMGILNITPDSFYSDSRFLSESEILTQAEKMISEGATFIDVGGYSSRPGAIDVSVEEEINRTTTAIRTIIKRFPTVIISIDTFRSAVAQQAVHEGALLINDISAGELDSKMFETVAALNVPYIAMHMRGTPQTMTRFTHYHNLLGEITDYFLHKLEKLKQLGIHDVILDPGFGFAKTIDQNFELLANLQYFKNLHKPMLAGLSRKSMIWKTLDTSADDALNGTTGLNMVALMNGASILRVHDVKAAVETIKLFSRL